MCLPSNGFEEENKYRFSVKYPLVPKAFAKLYGRVSLLTQISLKVRMAHAAKMIKLMEVFVVLVGACNTTAMGIMPHSDVDKAIELALSLDIPFWPQLPNVSYFEDMYAQFCEHFPGITVDLDAKKLLFDSERFQEELVTNYAEIMDDLEVFALSPKHSAVYHRFLERNLGNYPAIRGQVIGPVSFGFRVVDENLRPLIYNDDARSILFEFVQKKVNIQLRQMQEKNKNAFVWLDEPGLSWVFSAMSGYLEYDAKRDYASFLEGVEGPKALHLCANVNLDYLLDLGVDIVSFDAYQLGSMPKAYAESVARHVKAGKVISWGIVPTDTTSLSGLTSEKLANTLGGYWEKIAENSNVDASTIADRSLIAPARCCLKNIGAVGADDDVVVGDVSLASLSVEESIVERAFKMTNEVSRFLKQKYL